MSERSFCIFRRIHVRLTWASQVAYECFCFPPLVTKTDTWIRTLDPQHHDCIFKVKTNMNAKIIQEELQNDTCVSDIETMQKQK